MSKNHTTIFNQKDLVERATADVDLTKHNLLARKDILDKWIKFHENGAMKLQKEESLQGEFLSEVFAGVLNYTNITSGADEWHLMRELKTNIDGQKADGVLGFFSNARTQASLSKDSNNKKLARGLDPLSSNKIDYDVRVVIELKAPYFDLDSRQRRVGDKRTAVEQAFGYAPKYGGNCQWIIVSNYYEIRLYKSNDMSKYEVFYLDKLADEVEYKKFIYLLSRASLIGTGGKYKPKTEELWEIRIKAEKDIENKFYKLYSEIREKIFYSICDSNGITKQGDMSPCLNDDNISSEMILAKTQKLLDRFLFIAFAEDKGLIPANSYNMIVKNGQNTGFGIFETFKMFCGWINSGNKQHGINRYNGGLFAPDFDLDGLVIDDDIFIELEKIAEYNFDDELSETILGHIFEQSISDLEEIRAKLHNDDYDLKKGVRKKTGVFYTPQHITKYIVEKAIGNWLEDQKTSLGYDNLPDLDNDVVFQKNGKLTAKAQKHLDFWEKYRDRLKNIKVVDPACGSGAFLIEAFDFLVRKSTEVNDIISGFNPSESFSLTDDLNKDILLNNIYGVDLNAESVEITKLALWLKTANPNKPLENLDGNIICANSLYVDNFYKLLNNSNSMQSNRLTNDREEVLTRGLDPLQTEKDAQSKDSSVLVNKYDGFDVVIGNPPYVRQESIKEYKPYLQENYEVYNGTSDLYCYFYELGHKILNENGYLGFITSNKWFRAKYGQNLRKFVLEKTTVIDMVDYNGVKIFENATVDSNILVFRKNNMETKNNIETSGLDPLSTDKNDKNKKKIKNKSKNQEIQKYDFTLTIGSRETINYDIYDLSEDGFSFITSIEKTIKNKIEKIGVPLKEWDIVINRGVLTGLNDAFIIDKKTRDKLIAEDYRSNEIIKPLVRGRDIKKYVVNYADLYLIGTFPARKLNIEDYPAIKSHFENFGYNRLKQTGESGARKKTKNQWFEIQDTVAYWKEMENTKIIYPETVQGAYFHYDKNNYYIDKTCFMLASESENLEYLLGTLTSKLFEYVFKNLYAGHQLGKSGYQYNKAFLEKLPIKPFESIEIDNKIVNNVKLINEHSQKIKDYTQLLEQYESEKKFDNVIVLKKEIENSKNIFENSQREIDGLMFDLYGITNEERLYIEKNI